MVNFNSIVLSLYDIAEEVRGMPLGKICLVDSFHRDEIRYKDGVLVKLMNEVVSQLRIDTDKASTYDLLAREYTTTPGNLIPLDKANELYSAFYEIVWPEIQRIREHHN